MPPASGFETVVWTTDQRVPLVRAVLAALPGKVKTIGTGSPTGGDAARSIARSLDSPYDDDLRRLLIDRPPTYLLLATMDGVTPHALAAAVQGGATVLAIEPISARLDAVFESREPGRIIQLPGFTRSKGWLSAADPQLVLGPVHTIAIAAFFGGRDCSLFARLHEAWRLVLELAAMPESIHCVITSASGELPDDLRQLTGSITAHARLPDGGSASVQLHEATVPKGEDAPAAAWHREVHLVSERGWFRAGDGGYELFDHAGRPLDRHAPDAPPVTNTFAAAVTDHWRQLIDRPALTTERRSDEAATERAALACCLTCVLSARTAQPERPATIMQAHGRR